MDTLAFGYILPITGWIRDFNPLETCTAGRTNKTTDVILIHLPFYFLQNFIYPVFFSAITTSRPCACGATATGKFCPECGKPKPAAAADGWTCTCGAVNKGKFCAECGKPKPAGVPQYKCDKCGWEPADPQHPPKFCPECGDPFDDGDIV